MVGLFKSAVTQWKHLLVLELLLVGLPFAILNINIALDQMILCIFSHSGSSLVTELIWLMIYQAILKEWITNECDIY